MVKISKKPQKLYNDFFKKLITKSLGVKTYSGHPIGRVKKSHY